MLTLRNYPVLRTLSLVDLSNLLFDRYSRDWIESEDITSDIVEKEDRYIIKSELPGVQKENINITIENNTLKISAEKKDEFEEEKDNVYKRERSFGKYERVFILNNTVNTENIQAEFKDGILTLNINKNKDPLMTIEIK